MRVAGVVGGIGPESTIEYYRQIIAGWKKRRGEASNPRLVINSVDMAPLVALISAGDTDGLTSAFEREVATLAAAGADFAVLAANTPHMIFERLAATSPIPLISIVEVARDAALARGLRRLGLFGTRFTMQARFYPEVFEPAGITLMMPQPDEQDAIHDIYFRDLVGGVVRPEARAQLLEIVERMRVDEGVEGILLAGTELSLILSDGQARIPFLDTTHLHAARIVDELLA